MIKCAWSFYQHINHQVQKEAWHWLKIHFFTAHGKCKVFTYSQRLLTFTTDQVLSKMHWICILLKSTFIWSMRLIVLWQYEWQQQKQQQWPKQVSFNYALSDAWSWNLNQTPKNKLVQWNTCISIHPCIYLPSPAQIAHFYTHMVQSKWFCTAEQQHTQGKLW